MRDESTNGTSPLKSQSLRARRVAKVLEMKYPKSDSRHQLRKLEQLETKYVNNSPAGIPKATASATEYTVSFDEGMLGIALHNGRDLESKTDSDVDANSWGVFVATVAPDGQAAKQNVCVGDRIVAIQNRELPVDATWKDVFNLMAELERPISIKFQRE